jgi:isochorismate synthase
MNFLEALQLCIEKNLVFAAYRLPHSDAIRLVVQKDPQPKKVAITSSLFEKSGFIVSPFIEDQHNSSYLIQPDLNYISTDYENFNKLIALNPVLNGEVCFENGVVSKSEFIAQVEEYKKAIFENRFEKAVISRTKIIDRNYRSKLTEIFQLLCSSYTNAFIYIFNVAGQLWMGATPEPLICSHKNELSTAALAGTRQYNAENLNLHNWDEKERVEQGLVSLYVENTFKKFNINSFQKEGPYTKKAGNLIHLRTDYTLNFSDINTNIGDLVKELHPTSAVCGLPKKEAMEFILNTEKHKRGFYSGFLGPINLNERILLFVNLRCMKVLKDCLILYIGAGITNESVAEEEWAETEFKADTLLSIIHKV